MARTRAQCKRDSGELPGGFNQKKVEAAKNHRAFIAYDPGGYYLEWNAYNKIPINAELLKVIEER
jgi:hypothetical protein